MFTARIEISGGAVVELEPVVSSVTFTTNAVGGYGSCTFTADGMWSEPRAPYLSTVRLFWGTRQIWEGRIEDRTVSITKTGVSTAFSCLGFKRALDFTSLRRVWSTRGQQFDEIQGGDGTAIFTALTKTRNVQLTTGQYDPTDPTKAGVQLAGTGVAIAALTGQAGTTLAPIGVTWRRALATAVLSGTNTGAGKLVGRVVGYNAAGTNDGDSAAITASGSVDVAMTAAQELRVLAYNAGGGSLTPVSTDVFQLSNLRILGTTVAEDTAGGFYGGTILGDLLTLIPDLTVGLIEDGSDFTIQSLDYGVRASALEIVNAVAAFYQREWGVWDDRRFSWQTPQLDQAQWIVNIADCDEIQVGGSVDGNTRTAYVLYTDAATQRTGEQSSASTSQRNPFVRQAVTKDVLVQAPAVMTANTAAQLAARSATDNGLWPPVTGRIVLPATRLVSSAVGSAQPAFTVRAGCNISIPDLPKSDLFATGRDGETLFHVVSTDTDMGSDGGASVTLTIEGQQRYLDILMGRLAAATRVLTG